MNNVNNTQYNISSIFGYDNYFKYDVLKRLTLTALGNDKRNTANIYIDLYKMFLSLYGRGLAIGGDKKVLSSLVINLCAHIRGFYKYYNINTNFFLVYSDISTGFNVSYYPEYNKNNQYRMSVDFKTADLINVNIGLLDVLVPYLPNIYLVKGTVEPAVIIYDLIQKERILHRNNSPNIIFSKDPMVYQVPSLDKDTYIFRNNKKLGLEYVTGYENVYFGYLSLDSKRAHTISVPALRDKLLFISPELLGLLISITNLPSRYIKSMVDLPKAINYIFGAVYRQAIVNGYNSDINLLYNEIFDQNGGIYKISKEEFELRFRSIDLYHQVVEYQQTAASKDESYYTNLMDKDMINYINNNDYKDCPLDLINL